MITHLKDFACYRTLPDGVTGHLFARVVATCLFIFFSNSLYFILGYINIGAKVRKLISFQKKIDAKDIGINII